MFCNRRKDFTLLEPFGPHNNCGVSARGGLQRMLYFLCGQIENQTNNVFEATMACGSPELTMVANQK